MHEAMEPTADDVEAIGDAMFHESDLEAIEDFDSMKTKRVTCQSLTAPTQALEVDPVRSYGHFRTFGAVPWAPASGSAR
jgi:hypothetical protein